jgi:hypothetical protein
MNGYSSHTSASTPFSLAFAEGTVNNFDAFSDFNVLQPALSLEILLPGKQSLASSLAMSRKHHGFFISEQVHRQFMQMSQDFR